MAKKVRIELIRSVSRCEQWQKDTVKALGFKRRVRVVEKDLNAPIQGMIDTVSHLVRVSEVK